jgi:hypothetical protein
MKKIPPIGHEVIISQTPQNQKKKN